VKWISDFLLDVRQPRVRLYLPVFICYSLPKLMCTFDNVRIMCLVVFELHNNRLLDQTTTAQLQNDCVLFMTMSLTELLHFFIYGTTGFYPHGFTSYAINFRMTTVRIRGRTAVALHRLINDSCIVILQSFCSHFVVACGSRVQQPLSNLLHFRFAKKMYTSRWLTFRVALVLSVSESCTSCIHSYFIGSLL
jgi:hypothetical protein